MENCVCVQTWGSPAWTTRTSRWLSASDPWTGEVRNHISFINDVITQSFTGAMIRSLSGPFITCCCGVYFWALQTVVNAYWCKLNVLKGENAMDKAMIIWVYRETFRVQGYLVCDYADRNDDRSALKWHDTPGVCSRSTLVIPWIDSGSRKPSWSNVTCNVNSSLVCPVSGKFQKQNVTSAVNSQNIVTGLSNEAG